MRGVGSVVIIGCLATACAANPYRVSLLPLPASATTTNIYTLSNSGRAVGMASAASWATNRPTWWAADGSYQQGGGPSSKVAIGSPFDDTAILSYGTAFGPTAVEVRLLNGSLLPVELPTGNEFATVSYGREGSFYFVNELNKMYGWTPQTGSELIADFSELPGIVGPIVSATGMVAGSYSVFNQGLSSVAIVNGQKVLLQDFEITAVGSGNRFIGRGRGRGPGIWVPGESFTPIPAPALSILYPNGINAGGTIVGTHMFWNTENLTGFIRYGNDPYIDFGTISDIISYGAEGYTLDLINDHGVVGGHMRLNGVTRAFTATPVPEPGTLLGLAVAGLVLMRKRKA